MRALKRVLFATSATLGLLLLAQSSLASVLVQCPTQRRGAVLGDLNGDGMIRAVDGEITLPAYPREVCMSITGGDGFITMADDPGLVLYTFGFSNVTGLDADQIMDTGMLSANFPAPTIVLDEGDDFFLTLTNVGMVMRPDLFDPHSVHFHGFPNAASVFDGVPEASATINMGSSITYYYKMIGGHAGTYMYHCHVEATEHMQMGMLGNLYVRPAQNRLPDGTLLGSFTHHTGYTYAYNDGDGSTKYDVEAALQIGSMDSAFHESHIAIQPLPFSAMRDDYAMLNGRGYPDTVDPSPLAGPAENGGKQSQKITSRITATAGQKILLRLSNLDVTRMYTLGIMGMPMEVVGLDAKMLRGSGGQSLYYKTNSMTLGGGQSADVIVDTTGVPPGTYFLYCTNLNYLSNKTEDFGGMMTEIVLN